MSIEALIESLETAGFNTFLHDAPDGTACPYVVLQNIEHDNFGADNRVYVKTTRLIIRLVEAKTHNWELINELEDTLDALGLFYSSDDASLPAENVCETHYEINFYGGTKNA